MKKILSRILILLCVVAWSFGAQAQRSIDLVNDNYDASDDEVFRSSGHMPSFPGGDAALMKFIKDNMIYPSEALKNKIEGKVIVQFVVTKTGKVGKIKVVRSVNKELDQEAVRLIKMLPDFSPGRNNVGEPVNVWYILPVIFKLPTEPPAFPGGDAALLKFITQNLQYPTIDDKEPLQGKLLLKFLVKKTGEIGDVEVLNPLDTKLEKEAIRVIHLLPKFIPARDGKGEAIDYWYTLPLNITPNN